MVIFHSYVSLPEGIMMFHDFPNDFPMIFLGCWGMLHFRAHPPIFAYMTGWFFGYINYILELLYMGHLGLVFHLFWWKLGSFSNSNGHITNAGETARWMLGLFNLDNSWAIQMHFFAWKVTIQSLFFLAPSCLLVSIPSLLSHYLLLRMSLYLCVWVGK